MIRYLLDTNVVSEMMRLQPAQGLIDRYTVHQRQCAIASAVWHEMAYGVQRLQPGRRQEVLARYMTEVILRSLAVLPYDAPAADWHARERARLKRIGRPRPFVDGMIASVAATRGLVLVTRNEGDFSGFDGLEIENWFA